MKTLVSREDLKKVNTDNINDYVVDLIAYSEVINFSNAFPPKAKDYLENLADKINDIYDCNEGDLIFSKVEDFNLKLMAIEELKTQGIDPRLVRDKEEFKEAVELALEVNEKIVLRREEIKEEIREDLKELGIQIETKEEVNTRVA